MKGERIEITEQEAKQLLNEDSSYYYENPECKYDFIEEVKSYFDNEKGSLDIDVIIKRKSDGKFFKGEYTKSSAGGKYYDAQTLVEVIAKRVTIVKYETVY